ncbi:LOW QUALITY PROTEIN: uncharacterized protein [Primulina eburnea]|uniref:LOW QUALITY PROTEIN: uncharacterized protein n=1 Tax=Primulina eburnea TaxID=1245227 RepID=UPI003C6C7865
MACQVHTWSLSGLVAAFLNLAIAYLFLCVSAVAFFASKFLGFFGLHLPCPCKSIPSRDNCLNRLLVDFPSQQVSNVQLSVKEKFPFNDSIWERNHNNDIGADNCANEILEIEGDASCSSVSDVRQSRNVVGGDFAQWDEEYDVKGKGVISYRPRSRLHRRSRKGGVDHGKYSAASSYDPSLHEEILGSIPHSHSSSNKGGDGMTQGITRPVDYGGAYHIEFFLAFQVMEVVTSLAAQILSSIIAHKLRKMCCPVEDLQESRSFFGLEGNTIQLLEQELEEARAALDALYIELEKERSAAASAAEEAMAMILRLQEEKASTEMEARQHQRIFEEKSAYDAEEMEILKEILVRREMEKHLLEKEVDGYKQMITLGNQQLEDDGLDASGAPPKLFGLLIDPNDDPLLMLRQFSASTEMKLMTENRSSSGAVNESPIQDKGEKYISKKQQNLVGKSIQISGSANNWKQRVSTSRRIVQVLVACMLKSMSKGANQMHITGLPPLIPNVTSKLSDLRRSSMSIVDSGMVNVDNEVGQLLERLRIVKEGREKLSFSLENRGRENLQLKRLEDTASQVQQIRRLREPGNATLSKKKRCKSVSSGHQRSS